MAKYLIIAASSSIGQEVVNILKNNGHECVTTARDASKINPDIVLDATDFEAIEKAFVDFGPFDGAVNCAGSLFLKPAHFTNKTALMDVLNSSLVTAFSLVRAAGKYMKNGGSVVLISSAAAMEGLANHEAIAAAKAGIIGLMRSAAATYAAQNLRFNAIAPGLVETNLTQSITNNEAARNYSLNMHALGRFGTVQDIARAIYFLLDGQNNWITGQVIAIDGGLSRVRPKAKN